MNIQLYGKNIKITKAIRDHIEKKMLKLERFFNKDAYVKVDLEVDKHHKHGGTHHIEVHITSGSSKYFASQAEDNLYASVDKAYNQLKVQLSREHKKEKGDKRKTARFQRIMKSIWPFQKEADKYDDPDL